MRSAGISQVPSSRLNSSQVALISSEVRTNVSISIRMARRVDANSRASLLSRADRKAGSSRASIALKCSVFLVFKAPLRWLAGLSVRLPVATL